MKTIFLHTISIVTLLVVLETAVFWYATGCRQESVEKVVPIRNFQQVNPSGYIEGLPPASI